ncbi:casein kinase II subunit alpha [Nematocida minor]|uniref:casein kinase II subunit alpha n=1 Tax=Nematocida minor TaxID=1912983 RepID=UPI00221E4843|nr:casein kinase II subunit alpha [Nematocida minor]KAI5192780.1 casein kinase II subunit alpha [Nematocida minor]
MALQTTARVYTTAALKKGKEYYDYNEYAIEYGAISKYKITEFLGRGKYSQVFKGVTAPPEEKRSVVIKVLRPIREKKINREIKILKALTGVENVIQLLDVVKDAETNTRSLIFPYEDHTEARILFKMFTISDVIHYTKELLKTLDQIHSMGIFHRDLKPHNIIINHKTKILKIIDWGLAEYYLPSVEYATRVASLHFKAPELLLGFKYYDYSLDIWSAGCILGEMLFNRTPLFSGTSNEDQLEKIVSICGTAELKSYTNKYALSCPAKQLESINSKCTAEGTWQSLKATDLRVPQDSEEKEELISMLKKMLTFDHQKRPTAKECLSYKVFS